MKIEEKVHVSLPLTANRPGGWRVPAALLRSEVQRFDLYLEVKKITLTNFTQNTYQGPISRHVQHALVDGWVKHMF
jgi:hypothetical protein